MLLPQVASVADAETVGPAPLPIVAEVTDVQPFTSVKVTLYVPEAKLLNTCGELAPVWLKSPVILNGPTPPVHVTVTLPLLLPQVASVADAETVGPGVCEMFAEVTPVHPLASVTVTL